jgi:hypothetical protein
MVFIIYYCSWYFACEKMVLISQKGISHRGLFSAGDVPHPLRLGCGRSEDQIQRRQEPLRWGRLEPLAQDWDKDFEILEGPHQPVTILIFYIFYICAFRISM